MYHNLKDGLGHALLLLLVLPVPPRPSQMDPSPATSSWISSQPDITWLALPPPRGGVTDTVQPQVQPVRKFKWKLHGIWFVFHCCRSIIQLIISTNGHWIWAVGFVRTMKVIDSNDGINPQKKAMTQNRTRTKALLRSNLKLYIGTEWRHLDDAPFNFTMTTHHTNPQLVFSSNWPITNLVSVTNLSQSTLHFLYVIALLGYPWRFWQEPRLDAHISSTGWSRRRSLWAAVGPSSPGSRGSRPNYALQTSVIWSREIQVETRCSRKGRYGEGSQAPEGRLLRGSGKACGLSGWSWAGRSGPPSSKRSRSMQDPPGDTQCSAWNSGTV